MVNALGLHFQNSTGNVDDFFFILANELHFHRARLDACEQWRVLRQNAQLAGFSRDDYHLRLTRKNRALGGNDGYLKCMGHCRVAAYCIVLAFSNASSMPPTI